MSIADLLQLILVPSQERLEVYAVGYQMAWVLALALGTVALISVRQHIFNHRRELVPLLCIAVVVRVVFGDFFTADEQWPYITQAACIAFKQARVGVDVCSAHLYGDVHQLGTASLFALGFRLFGGYKTVAGSLVLVASVLNVGLMYGLSQRAFGDRPTSLLATFILAVHPWAVHFSGATQTETFNDTFLLLAALLVVWDLERGSTPSEKRLGWAARLAAHPALRAFFAAMAVNVRPELLVLTPILIASTVWGERHGRRRVSSGVMLALVAAPLLVVAMPGLLLKAHTLAPCSVQVVYAIRHLLGSYERILGPLGLPLLVIGFWLTTTVRWTPSLKGRGLSWLSLALTTVYLVLQGLYDHVMRDQPHVIYHGTVLWWPMLARAAIAGLEWFGQRTKWGHRVSAEWHAFAAALVLGVLFHVSLKAPYLWPLYLNVQTGSHSRLANAIPNDAHVIHLHKDKFEDGGVVTVLMAHGRRTLLAPEFRDGVVSERACLRACASVSEALRQQRAIKIVERCEVEQNHRFLSDFTKVCGLMTSASSTAGGFCIWEVTAPCSLPGPISGPAQARTKEVLPDQLTREPRHGPNRVSGRSTAGISPETAKRVFEALKAVSGEDGCNLEGVSTSRDTASVVWRTAEGSWVKVQLRVPRMAGKITLHSDSTSVAECPSAIARLERLLEQERAVGGGENAVATQSEPRGTGFLVGTSVFMSYVGRSAVAMLGHRAIVVLLLTAAVVLILRVVRWRCQSARSRQRRPTGASDDESTEVERGARATESWALDVMTGVAVAAVVAFFLSLFGIASRACLSPMDRYWLEAVPHVLASRSLARVETGLLGRTVLGHYPAFWPFFCFAGHGLNAVLLGLLGRQLGLPRPWARVTALTYLAVPTMSGAFYAEYLLEFRLLSAFLTVCLAYIARSRARSSFAYWGWFAVECCAVLVGVGNKESYVVYPILLIALEIVVCRTEDSSWTPRNAVLRLAPHVVLETYACYALIEPFATGSHRTKPISFAPYSMLEQAQRLTEGPLVPVLPDAVDAGPLGLVVFGGLLLVGYAAGRYRVGVAFAAILAGGMLAPMLPLQGRDLPGYNVAPAAGIVLALVATAAGVPARGVPLFVGIWLACALAKPPSEREREQCDVVDSRTPGSAPLRDDAALTGSPHPP